MTEYGIFSDEGLIEGDCWSHEEAFATMCTRYDEEDDLHVGEVCSQCRASEYTLDGCEDCDHEDEED